MVGALDRSIGDPGRIHEEGLAALCARGEREGPRLLHLDLTATRRPRAHPRSWVA